MNVGRDNMTYVITDLQNNIIKEYTDENIDALVEKIVTGKLQEGELSLTPITFQDVDTIKEIFKKRLKAIYHTRISYPGDKKAK